MIILKENKEQRPVAYIYNNILASIDNKVLGIVLGHCVFGRNGKVTGKYFQHKLFNLEGEILAERVEEDIPVEYPENLLQDAWQIISRIKDHSCPMVEPLERWSELTIEDHFAASSVFSLAEHSARR